MGIKKDGAFTKEGTVLLFLLVLNITHNIPHFAFEDPAKSLDRMGADALVAFKPRYLGGAYVVILYKGILGDPPLFHYIPKVVVRNQNIQAPSHLNVI